MSTESDGALLRSAGFSVGSRQTTAHTDARMMAGERHEPTVSPTLTRKLDYASSKLPGRSSASSSRPGHAACFSATSST